MTRGENIRTAITSGFMNIFARLGISYGVSLSVTGRTLDIRFFPFAVLDGTDDAHRGFCSSRCERSRDSITSTGEKVTRGTPVQSARTDMAECFIIPMGRRDRTPRCENRWHSVYTPAIASRRGDRHLHARASLWCFSGIQPSLHVSWTILMFGDLSKKEENRERTRNCRTLEEGKR